MYPALTPDPTSTYRALTDGKQLLSPITGLPMSDVYHPIVIIRRQIQEYREAKLRHLMGHA